MNQRLMKDILFEEIGDSEIFADYTANCPTGRSECCSRKCTEYQANDSGTSASEEEWGRFLELEGGVIQY